MQTNTLPMPIERDLAALEHRHKRHQRMLDAHHDAKHQRRERHRARSYTRKLIPILFL